MRVERTVYFIITKKRPIKFHIGDGNTEGEFEDAEMYQWKDEAEEELSCFDEPENFEIISGTVAVDI